MDAEGGPGSARLWAAILVLAVVAALFGYAGLDAYLAGQEHGPAGFWEKLYYTAQMFVLGSVPVDRPRLNVNLGIGLFLAPFTTVLAVLQAVSTVFRAQYVAWRLRRARGHAVVVGTGAAPFVLAQRLAAEVTTVLVGSDVTAEVARRHRLHVVPGDPMDRATLEAAGVQGAAEVFALSDAGSENAAVALLTRRLQQERRQTAVRARRQQFWRRQRPLPNVAVYARANDPRLVAAMRARRLGAEGSDPDDGYTLDFFSIEQRAAVALLEEHDDDRTLPAAVVGSDLFADAVTTELRRRRLRAGVDAAVAVVTTARCDDVPADTARVYVCASTPDEVLRVGLQLLLRDRAQVVLCLGRKSVLSQALGNRLFDDIEGRLQVFGVLDTALAPAELRRRALVEQLARALHARYLLDYAPDVAAGRPTTGPRAQDSHVPWKDLAERFRDDNRAQAADIGRKLSKINAVVVPATPDLPPFAFGTDENGDDEVETLARMEHERWMGAKSRAGFRWGPSRTGTTHPDYVPWERRREDGDPAPGEPVDLAEEIKEKDRIFVRDLPQLLEVEGLAIVRRAAEHGGGAT